MRFQPRCRDFAHLFLQCNETDASQVRSKIRDRAPHQQDFVMQRRDETGDRQALLPGNLLEAVPKDLFEPDAGALPIEPN